MQQTIIEILKHIESRKREAGKQPTAPLLMELNAELKTRLLHELDTMQRAGIITVGNTINDKYIKLNV
jgi:soluble P-type ATPase